MPEGTSPDELLRELAAVGCGTVLGAALSGGGLGALGWWPRVGAYTSV